MSPTVELPAGSEIGHSFEYGLDVNIGTTVDPIWQTVRRISDFQPTPTAKTQPAQTYDDFGADNNEVVGWNTNLSFGVLVNRSSTTGLYLPEIEALLARTRPSAKGAAAVIEARWYHKPETGTPNPDDAGQGFFTVGRQRANAGSDGAVERLNFTLTGKGNAKEIVNPFTGWDAVEPTISSASPTGAETGDLVTLTGTDFNGTASVTIDAVEADFQVVGNSTIVFAVPAGSAGEVDIVVTNGVGASAAYAYTRAA